MKKLPLLFLSLCLSVLPTACGGSGSSSGNKGDAYPSDVRQNFLSSCEASASANVSFDQAEQLCECLLGKIEAKYTIEQFIEAEQNIFAGRASGIDLESLAASCL